MKLWIKYFLLGAVSCWAPETIIAALARRPDDWQMANLFLPLTACLAYWVASKLRTQAERGPSLAGVMVLGIYVLGPLFMTLENTFAGAGFHEMHKWDWLILLFLSFVPPYTLVMATYDLSLYALVFVTVFLSVAHWRREKDRWVLPFGKDHWIQPITR